MPTPEAPPVTANNWLLLALAVPLKVIEIKEALQFTGTKGTFGDQWEKVPTPVKTDLFTLPIGMVMFEVASEQVGPVMVPAKLMVAVSAQAVLANTAVISRAL